MKYQSAKEIFDEMAGLTPSCGGMSYERLNEKGLCWSCSNPDRPETQYRVKLHSKQIMFEDKVSKSYLF